MITIKQAQTTADVGAAEGLMREYLGWWATQQPQDFATAPTFHGLDEELRTLPGIYAPPAGRLLLAKVDGQAAGCVCLKPHDGPTAELKRLYVRPGFRGHHLGRQLVERLIAEARAAGYTRIVLDSHITMKPAHAIYAAAGFTPMPPPDDLSEALKAVVIYMECDLSAQALGQAKV